MSALWFKMKGAPSNLLAFLIQPFDSHPLTAIVFLQLFTESTDQPATFSAWLLVVLWLILKECWLLQVSFQIMVPIVK